MGLFDLAGKVIGGAVGFAVDVAKEAHDITVEDRIQQEINASLNVVDNETTRMREQWLADANAIKRRRAESLYRIGLQQTMHDTTSVIGTCGCKTKAIEMFWALIRKDVSVSELEDYVKTTYDFYLDKKLNEEDLSYVKLAKKDSVFESIFQELQNEWIADIKSVISENLKGTEVLDHNIRGGENISFLGIKTFLIDDAFLLILLNIITGDSRYIEVFNLICDYCYKSSYMLNALHENEYGDFDINVGDKLLDDGHTYASMAENAVAEARSHICENETGYFEGIKKYLDYSILENTSINLWHYAMLTPFNQQKFNKAVEGRNFFTSSIGNDFEVILAELYVKNQLGGSELVLQNLDIILKEAASSNPDYARGLCSFLAWMECYDLEYEVLKRTVANKIQLSEEMQKRLAFLADGGKTASIKVYKIDDTSEFCFDTHAIEWQSTEYEMLFHKLKASKTRLNYALVTKGWHKPFPIQHGKQFHMESLEKEFEKLVSDFEGEVVLEKKTFSCGKHK